MRTGLRSWGVCAALVLLVQAERGSADEEMVSIPVAIADIKAQTTLTTPEELFKFVKMPKGSIPERAIRNLNRLRDAVLLRDLKAGTPLAADDILDGLMTQLLPKRYRAVAVKCPSESVGDYIKPGHRVDLLCTISSPKGRLTKTFIAEILVLATSQRADRDEAGKPQEPIATLWLALKPEDAERVIWVATQGSIIPTLRRPDDQGEPKTPGATSPFKAGEEPVETALILVAVKTIRKGTVLDDPTDYFELRECPKNTAVEGALLDPAKLKGKRVVRTLPTNSQVTEDDLEPDAKK